ncbi:MAG: uracil-DNA glycosylase family protein [Candidatus Woesearchaeota archaeon]
MVEELIVNCPKACDPDIIGQGAGFKGENADQAKIMFILHTPNDTILGQSYITAFNNSTTGTVIRKMLDFCYLDTDDIYVTNLYKCLLKGERKPRKTGYEACIQHLNDEILDFHPEKIILGGRPVYLNLFPYATENLDDVVGNTLDYRLGEESFPCFLSYHPGMLEQRFTIEKRQEHYHRLAEFLDPKDNKEGSFF